MNSIDDFQEAIDRDFINRRQELTALRLLVMGINDSDCDLKLVTRSGILIIYAHWEGFVKRACQCFFMLINNEKLKYSQLKSCFEIHRISKYSNYMRDLTYQHKLKIVESHSQNPDVFINIDKYTNFNSNLNSKEIKKICQKIGLDYQNYELKETFIDHNLLSMRNQIAHGSNLTVTKVDFIQMHEKSVELITNFKNDILDYVLNQEYRAQS